MDDTANRHARELVEALRAAVARDADVQACRERARAEGVELKVSLEVAAEVIGRDGTPARAEAVVTPLGPAAKPCEMTAADRRFLRSLRIAVDQGERE